MFTHMSSPCPGSPDWVASSRPRECPEGRRTIRKAAFNACQALVTEGKKA